MPYMNTLSYCAPPPPQAFAANDWNAVNNSNLNLNLNLNVACSSSRRCNSSSSTSQQQQQQQQQFYQQQHTTSLAINNLIKNQINKHYNHEETTSIDLPTLPQSMPSTPMQPLHMQQQQQQYKMRTTIETRSNYEKSYTHFDSDTEQEHNIDDSDSNLSINTSPPCTQTNAAVYSCSNNFEPLTQLKRKWTKLQRHRHRRRHSNGSCGDAKELDKLVLQSVAWDDSDIY